MAGKSDFEALGVSDKVKWMYFGALFLNVALLVWGMNRGFAYTDEALYAYLILNVERASYFLSSFHKVYDAFFGWIGTGLLAVRAVTLALALAASAVLAYGIKCWLQAVTGVKRSFAFLFTWTSLFTLFIFSEDPQTISYNTLPTFLLMAQIGTLFLLVSANDRPTPLIRNYAIAIIVGSLAGAVFFCRFTTGLLSLFAVSGFFMVYPSGKNLVQRSLMAGVFFIGFVGFLILGNFVIEPLPSFYEKISTNKEVFALSGQTNAYYLENLHNFINVIAVLGVLAFIPGIAQTFYLETKHITKRLYRNSALFVISGFLVFVFIVGLGFLYRSVALQPQTFIIFAVIFLVVSVVVYPRSGAIIQFKFPETLNAAAVGKGTVILTLGLLLCIPAILVVGTSNQLILNMHYGGAFLGAVLYIVLSLVNDDRVPGGKKLWHYAFIALFTIGFSIWYIADPYIGPPIYKTSYPLKKSENGEYILFSKEQKQFFDALRTTLDEHGFQKGDKIIGVDVNAAVYYLLDAKSAGGIWYNRKKAKLNFLTLDEEIERKEPPADIFLFHDRPPGLFDDVLKELRNYNYDIEKDFRQVAKIYNPNMKRDMNVFVRVDSE